MEILKSVLYRGYSIFIAFVFFYLITGEFALSGKYTGMLELIKLVQYFIFEKIWKKISSTHSL